MDTSRLCQCYTKCMLKGAYRLKPMFNSAFNARYYPSKFIYCYSFINRKLYVYPNNFNTVKCHHLEVFKTFYIYGSSLLFDPPLPSPPLLLWWFIHQSFGFADNPTRPSHRSCLIGTRFMSHSDPHQRRTGRRSVRHKDVSRYRLGKCLTSLNSDRRNRGRMRGVV